ncbi:16S rRNA (uracil(1498)-N(3))-methyltransferase [Mesonia mobilis]|uniref:Ribosomal RNA small subunit methyltransferase E n=2 Tax=Mesonia mobilis TaxID=369791 RepID=A0ABQ3BKN1_9FLAO|nr:16S rRNA (uracil(1498)-N(3))-methyltransferase [Mesonia mobilis]MBQ0737619.1 16S rRNA (uracil(1498)-N(3))-methyltransferase [Aquimarina celericrescens]GGZ49469.1 ribosomal RNA small subunit methyltransferase E [Mesonia mobilis]
MQLFYNPAISSEDKEVIFPKDESKHIVKVLRKQEGDNLNITNGKGFLFSAEIIEANHNKCKAKITAVEQERDKKYHIHLAVAPTKMNDRFETFLEKATEIGLDKITPIICDHSERKVVKINRFERVLQSAMKQSLHYSMPEISEAISFQEFIQQEQNEQKFIAHCEENEKKSLQKELEPGKSYTILIGPEGDFSSEEIKSAIKAGFIPVTLGNTRLRTETAAIVAAHTAALINEFQ